MSYNGSGTFSINTSGQPVVAATTISASVFNAFTADIATGLTTAICKDGQTTTTASIPFAVGIAVTTGITTPSTTFALVNTTATTVNFAGGASVAINAGHASGTTTWLGAFTLSSTLTLSGTASNIALGSNFISNGGTDAGLSFDGSNNATLSGALQLTPGSLGAPSLHFSDTTSGFYRVAAGQVGLQMAGALTWYATAAGEIRNPLQPCVLAYNSVTDANVTGDGTVYTTICDTEVFDQNADYNNGTGTFTASVTGRYLIHFQALLTGTGASETHEIAIVTNNRSYIFQDTFGTNPFSQRTLSVTAIADMNAGDTATFTVTLSGGTLDVDVFGGASAYTFVSIGLFC